MKKIAAASQDTELANVVAVLPGTIDKDRYVMIGGHYDSIALRRSGAGQPAERQRRLGGRTRNRWLPAWRTTLAARRPSWNWRVS